jgi:hypothetical protein
MLRLLTVLVATLLSTACTFASVKPQTKVDAPKERPTILVLGDIGVTDKLWETYRLYFVRGAEGWLRSNPGFKEVLVERTAPLPEGSAVLVGTITEVERGSPALRFFVGMGAGQARARGSFEIHGPAGESYVRFTSHESYLGGAGIGGAGILDLEDLMKRFGETVAKTAAKWARGEPLDQ